MSTPSTGLASRQMKGAPVAWRVAMLLVLSCRAQQCSSPTARAGTSQRWPTANPGLVAPVTVTYDYQLYRQPLISEFIGDAIAIRVPPNFLASFNLTDSGGAAAEQYVLKSIELRKPGRVPPGTAQALDHVFEAAFLHQEVTGTGRWANVVVPFQLNNDPAADILSTLTSGVTLPSARGELVPMLLSSALTLDLGAIWRGASFQTYWTTLPTSCQGTLVNTRQFMRNVTLGTVHSTYMNLLAALGSAPENLPASPAEVSWLTGTCRAGDVCAPPQATDLSTFLSDALQTQSNAVADLRAKKAAMDQALLDLRNETPGSYEVAVNARDLLRAADSELTSVRQAVSRLETWQGQVQNNTWDADAPAAFPTTAAPTAPPIIDPFSDTTSNGTNSSDQASFLARGADTVGGALAIAGRVGDCAQLGESPVDIDTSKVVRPSFVSLRSLEPLHFKHVVPAAGTEQGQRVVQVENSGDHLHVTDWQFRTAAEKDWPFGTVASKGLERPISFVDVRVPSEHSVDGQVFAAEVQLVQQPQDGEPAVAIALHLDDSDDRENVWLRSLLSSPPGIGGKQALRMDSSLAELHEAFRRGSAARYYRYDGTLTRAPCYATEWYVLEEHGHISEQQLADLVRLLPALRTRAERPPFAAGLVAEGVQHLAPQKPGSAQADAPRGQAGLLGGPQGARPP